MIDKDTLRVARRTVERNGYTVLPPRESDERDLDRFRSRREFARQVNDDDEDYRPARPASRQSRYEDDYEETRPTRPVRKEMNDDEKLGAAIRTAEENGFTIRKMSKLDQAKQVARDNGFDVRRIEKPFDGVQSKKPIAPVAGGSEGNDRPVRRVATQDGTPIRRPVLDREMARKNADAVRTRTAPDVEMKKEVPQDSPKGEPTETPKKPTYEDEDCISGRLRARERCRIRR